MSASNATWLGQIQESARSKKYFICKRVLGFRSPETGKQQSKTCGVWPQKSPGEIRSERNRLRTLVQGKIDPLESERREQETANRIKRETQDTERVATAEAARLAARMTVIDLFARWQPTHLAERKDWGARKSSALLKKMCCLFWGVRMRTKLSVGTGRIPPCGCNARHSCSSAACQAE